MKKLTYFLLMFLLLLTFFNKNVLADCENSEGGTYSDGKASCLQSTGKAYKCNGTGWTYLDDCETSCESGQCCIKASKWGTDVGVACSYDGNACSASCDTNNGWQNDACASDMITSASGSANCYINDANCENIATCYKCTAPTCVGNGVFCSDSNPNKFQYLVSGLTCPGAKKCISCKSNVACVLNNAGEEVSSGGPIKQDGTGCSKVCPPACTCKTDDQNNTCKAGSGGSGATSFEQTGGDTCTTITCQGKKDCNDNNVCTKDNCEGKALNASCPHDPNIVNAECGGGNCKGLSCGQTDGGKCQKEGNGCGLKCSDLSCDKSCGYDDAETPGQVELTSPIGTLNSPTVYKSGAKVTFKWKKPDKLTDSYQFQILNKADGVEISKSVGTTTTSASGLANGIYHWSVVAVNSTCESVGVGRTYTGDWSDYGYFVLNSPPVFKGLTIKNNESKIVSAETGNKNQICQTDFNGVRRVTFEVSASDPDGDAITVSLKWNNNTVSSIPSLNIGSTFVFGWNSSEIPSNLNNGSTYPLVATITDSFGATAVDTSRKFKIWDCGVSVSGTFYDSTGGVNCVTNTGFNTIADQDILKLTDFSFFDTNNNVGVSMTTNSPANTYSSGSNKLIWGSVYNKFIFNDGFSMADPALRDKDPLATEWSCNGAALYTSDADPYVASPSLIADFFGILIQDPWWQANGGGVISNTSVKGEVPSTCITDNCKISIDGLVSAPTISNIANKPLSNYQTWYYGNTSDARLADYNTNYSYFYSQYFAKKEVGTTLVGDKNILDIGETGIYFVDGNLNIDTDKILTNHNDFLMIIVKGDINVGIGASQVDGIFVANNIGASGTSDNQLVFNGSLYAADSVNFSRDYSTNRIRNNTIPAVVVKYNPELIFNLPGGVAKVLTNWQWGN
jgi:hypothetical protein